MKYLILLSDGMPDYPIEDLGGKTPLEAAFTPNMDIIAREGCVGMVKTVPEGFDPGSDVCNLCILGYDPALYYSGRAPLEAAAIGVKLDKDDVAFRCNLVTLRPEKNAVIMEDFSAGHIDTCEARELIELLEKNLGSDEFKFYPGMSYRHLMVWKGGPTDIHLTPPHDITGKDIKTYMPRGKRAYDLNRLMNDSQMLLVRHKGSFRGKEQVINHANSIWLWGHGKSPAMPTIKERFGLDGSLIAAVDLMKGIGIYAGLEPVEVPGATGYIDTNFEGKAEYALKELEKKDFVYMHVEAPDEAGHNGSVKLKIKAIEDFDKAVGKILEGIKKFDRYRILLTSDHRTPISLRTHSNEPVPFGIFPALEGKKGVRGFSEREAETSGFKVERGYELIELLLDKNLNSKN